MILLVRRSRSVGAALLSCPVFSSFRLSLLFQYVKLIILGSSHSLKLWPCRANVSGRKGTHQGWGCYSCSKHRKGPAALPLGRLQIPNGSIVLFFDGFGYPGMCLPPAVLNGLPRYLPVCSSESSSQGLVPGMIRQAGSLNRSDSDVGQGDVLCLLHRSEAGVLDHLQEALMTMVRSEA